MTKSKTSVKSNEDGFKTFRTSCYTCGKNLDLVNFNVSIGGNSFALCPRHLEEMIKVASKEMGSSL